MSSQLYLVWGLYSELEILMPKADTLMQYQRPPINHIVLVYTKYVIIPIYIESLIPWVSEWVMRFWKSLKSALYRQSERFLALWGQIKHSDTPFSTLRQIMTPCFTFLCCFLRYAAICHFFYTGKILRCNFYNWQNFVHRHRPWLDNVTVNLTVRQASLSTLGARDK